MSKPKMSKSARKTARRDLDKAELKSALESLLIDTADLRDEKQLRAKLDALLPKVEGLQEVRQHACMCMCTVSAVWGHAASTCNPSPFPLHA